LKNGEARLIREIKRGCTYRRLAEIYYPIDHNGHGNQLYGEDLCKEACGALGINWAFSGFPPPPLTPEFDAVNKSRIGDFYWWE